MNVDFFLRMREKAPQLRVRGRFNAFLPREGDKAQEV